MNRFGNAYVYQFPGASGLRKILQALNPRLGEGGSFLYDEQVSILAPSILPSLNLQPLNGCAKLNSNGQSLVDGPSALLPA
jgi:hypothetical protein